ncbi:MAG: YraN family protein [Bacteroidales bacterium]|nr:YraN family protein [Bacteroidales bacterium]
MSGDNLELGKTGEEAAIAYYLKQNYTILDTNWRFGHLEVDVIAENEDTIVFCEVKTRSSNCFGEPESFVTLQKQKNIIRAANSYVLRKGINKDVRFDVISIIKNNNGCTLNHIPDAFCPKW